MRSKRNKQSGFTLLEALLAAAVLALLAVPIMSAFGQAVQQSQPRITAFEAHEFAVSLLEERAVTRNFANEAGLYGDRFQFEVTASPRSPIEPTRYDDLIHFTELEVRVSDATRDEQAVSLSQVFAHKPR